MKVLGIVYAISRSAGDLCKATVQSLAESTGTRDLVIKAYEKPAIEYKNASDQKIVDLVVDSISHLVKKHHAEIVIISANSIHRVFSEIKRVIGEKYEKVKLISMVDATVDTVLQQNIQCVSIFGSDSTIRSKLYQLPLQRNHIGIVLPNEDEQLFVNGLIKRGVSQDTSLEDREQLRCVANSMKSRGAETVILACAELPVVFNSNNLDIDVVDTNYALAKAAIEAIK